MNKVILGNTGIEVTELCFGVLPIGPAQKNVPAEEAAETIALGMDMGITFFDTAQMYQTYEHLALALKKTGKRPVIATKSAAATYEDMDRAVKEALEKLGVDNIDIFFIHAARVGINVFEERAGALECLLDYKVKGVIKAVGISCHAVDVIGLAADMPDIDVVFAILNKTGMGILRGGKSDMEDAINKCFDNGKGVMIMKALAGGNLIGDFVSAMDYVREFSKGRAAIAVGMVEPEEVRINIDYFNDNDISGRLEGVSGGSKGLMVYTSLCKSCGKCAEACHSQAISMGTGRAVINKEQCLKCGYCVMACPEFAIRMV